DMFYNSLGIHASSLVMVAYLRNYWLGVITPQGGYDAGLAPTLAANGLQWFMVYTIPLVFLHHTILFFTEAGGFGLFWFTVLKIMASTVFTSGMIIVLQYLAGGSRR
ncbi:MAG: Rod shape-determining protein MreD, partial [Cyclobacteriaceae bacterium]